MDPSGGKSSTIMIGTLNDLTRSSSEITSGKKPLCKISVREREGECVSPPPMQPHTKRDVATLSPLKISLLINISYRGDGA